MGAVLLQAGVGHQDSIGMLQIFFDFNIRPIPQAKRGHVHRFSFSLSHDAVPFL